MFIFFFLTNIIKYIFFFFFSSRRRHTRFSRDWSSDVCSSDLAGAWSAWQACWWARLTPRAVPITLARADASPGALPRWGPVAMVAAGLRGGAQGSPAHRAERPTSAVGDPSNLIRVIPAKGAAMAIRIRRAPEWGIQPVPPELRKLGLLDQAVLWGNLGISLLVLVAGALLVPADRK